MPWRSGSPGVNPCGPPGGRRTLHRARAMSVPGAAVRAAGYPPRQERAVLLSARCCDAAGNGFNAAASSPLHPALAFPGGRGEVSGLEKHLGWQIHGVGITPGQIRAGARLRARRADSPGKDSPRAPLACSIQGGMRMRPADAKSKRWVLVLLSKEYGRGKKKKNPTKCPGL